MATLPRYDWTRGRSRPYVGASVHARRAFRSVFNRRTLQRTAVASRFVSRHGPGVLASIFEIVTGAVGLVIQIAFMLALMLLGAAPAVIIIKFLTHILPIR